MQERNGILYIDHVMPVLAHARWQDVVQYYKDLLASTELSLQERAHIARRLEFARLSMIETGCQFTATAMLRAEGTSQLLFRGQNEYFHVVTKFTPTRIMRYYFFRLRRSKAFMRQNAMRGINSADGHLFSLN